MAYKINVKDENGDRVAGAEFDDEEQLGAATQALAPTILKNNVTVEVSTNGD